MALIGYHASHEQYPPSELLTYIQAAEAAGFQAGMCSDHFAPWSENQGHSGFAWSWLAAALQATKLSFGTVNAPGYRYHPAIIAQAAATLAEMYPERFWLAIGSGEAMNEHITGQRWPAKAERNARLKECADVMRALWAGETVTHHGLVTVEDAKIYSLPKTPPLLVGAAITPETAEWMGGWVDGIVTVYKPREKQQQFIDAFRRGGGEGKPMFLQVQLSYDTTDAAARAGAHEQWRYNIFESSALGDLRLPEQFDAVAKFVKPDELEGHVRISSSLQQHIDWIGEDIALGFERVMLHNVNRKQQAFIEAFGAKVIPALAG